MGFPVIPGNHFGGVPQFYEHLSNFRVCKLHHSGESAVSQHSAEGHLCHRLQQFEIPGKVFLHDPAGQVCQKL